jgi:Predicted glycosyltransferases
MTMGADSQQRVSSPVAHAETRLAVVTVTFHPDLWKLEQQLAMLPSGAASFIVDNASDSQEVTEIKRLVAARPNTFLIENNENLGLAAATNRGARHASEQPGLHDFLLLMDQDSQPQVGAIENLMSAFLQLEDQGQRVGCVGPQLIDAATGLCHGFHSIRGWRWIRTFPCAGSTAPVRCANLNGSGTLMHMSLYQTLGGLDEELFIDHVDTEWAFRVLAAGFELFGIPEATFNHSMGERGLRFWWFGWRVWPQRSPQRHYYLFRNACCLLRRSYIPHVWKFWAVVKLLLTMSVYFVLDTRRVSHMCNMLAGIRDACSSRKKN